jgi:hypothetical protein
MVPQVFVVLDALPLTSNDKVDREALPAPPSLSEAKFARPRDEVEAALCGVFGEVLGLESVGIFDNFFELGGDSIMSIRIVSRARQRKLRLRSRDIFEHQTVASLAELLKVTRESASVPHRDQTPKLASSTEVDFDALLSEIQS